MSQRALLGPCSSRLSGGNAVCRRHLLRYFLSLYFAWQNIWPWRGWIASSTPIICFRSKFCASFRHPVRVYVSWLCQIAGPYPSGLDDPESMRVVDVKSYFALIILSLFHVFLILIFLINSNLYFPLFFPFISDEDLRRVS